MGIEIDIYISDLEARHDLAIDTLGELASGRGRKEDDKGKCKKDYPWSVSMQRLAREDLVKIAKMPLRKPK